MSRKALKVVVELKFRAVSCPGVHLPAKDDIYLSICFMGQYCQSECLPAVFPLLFHEMMTFEKIFRHAVDPGDIAVMLEYETVTIELVQLIPPVADTLAYFEEDTRRFLFPEPKLVPSFSGVDREILMTRAPHFQGIAPRLEFSTKTTIIECSADAEINIYPNVPMKPMIKRNRKPSSRPRSSSPQRRQPQTLGKKQGGRAYRENRTRSLSHTPEPQSLSPLRTGNTKRLEQLSLDSTALDLADWDQTSISQNMLASWPGASWSDSPHCSAVFTNSFSPLTSSSSVRHFPTGRRKSLSNGLVGGISESYSSSSETHDSLGYHQDHDSSGLWRSYRSQSSSHKEWEEVQERVRGLLTTPKAVRRLVYGATHSEVSEVLSRRSISPGPP
ncbi:spermatogenesis associated 6-like protein isoform X4 [Epinephelus moara]|uniref:spermatogenesis associated 6-like protein isoform X4 n=1 Tax=Epinephelus moara TaxID=300413 RepID=UPI00214E05A9|nr:spermatogenesis associated 6-like protein isoform X4 [Epinephelus moara]